MAVPEAGLEAALDLKVIEFNFNNRRLAGKIAADISGAHLDAEVFAPLALRPDDHMYLSWMILRSGRRQFPDPQKPIARGNDGEPCVEQFLGPQKMAQIAGRCPARRSFPKSVRRLAALKRKKIRDRSRTANGANFKFLGVGPNRRSVKKDCGNQRGYLARTGSRRS